MPDFLAQFVILTHDWPDLHWDFMLEIEATLHTWRLSQLPDSEGRINATRLPDHRLHYLDYEGPVSNNRGCVRRWDRGSYSVVEVDEDRVEVRLEGEHLCGRALLIRSDEKDAWQFEFTAEEA